MWGGRRRKRECGWEGGRERTTVMAWRDYHDACDGNTHQDEFELLCPTDDSADVVDDYFAIGVQRNRHRVPYIAYKEG